MFFKSMYNIVGYWDIFNEQFEFIIFWVGYGFFKDYNQFCGYVYVVADFYKSFWIGVFLKEGEGFMLSICWICKSLDVFCLMKEIGVVDFYSYQMSDFGSEVINFIGCVDCYDF